MDRDAACARSECCGRRPSVWKQNIAVFVLAAMIVGLLLLVAAMNVVSGTTVTRRMTAAQRMNMIASAITQYQLDCGDYPITLAALTPKYIAEAPVDTWDRPYVYAPTPGGENPFKLSSAGAAGQDVIDYWKEKGLASGNALR